MSTKVSRSWSVIPSKINNRGTFQFDFKWVLHEVRIHKKYFWFSLLHLRMKSYSVISQMKTAVHYFNMVPFILMFKVVLTFESVDKILKCSHLNESYWAVLSNDAVYCAVQGGPNFWVCGWNPQVWPFKWKLLSSACPVVLFMVLWIVFLTIESVNEILKCDHSNESYWAVVLLVSQDNS